MIWQNKLERLHLADSFRFVYYLWITEEWGSKSAPVVCVPAFITNIRLAWINLQRTNALAFFAVAPVLNETVLFHWHQQTML